MIIVDDCSTDNTVKIVQEISKKDPRVRYLKQNTNGGAAKARNRSLNEVREDMLLIWMRMIYGNRQNLKNKFNL